MPNRTATVGHHRKLATFAKSLKDPGGTPDRGALVSLASERAHALVQLAGKRLDAAIAAARARADDMANFDTVDAVLRGRPDLRDRIGEIQESSAREAERLKAAAAAVRDTLAALARDLKKRAADPDT